MTADEIFSEAFSRPRDPRSEPYRAGVLAALEYRIDDKPIAQPYALGTAEADAFGAGLDEGHRLWRDSLFLVKMTVFVWGNRPIY